MRQRYGYRGISLIEMLAAMLISLVLISSLVALFVANKKSYQLSQAMTHLQDSARYVVPLLAQDIRMAGYLGCNSRASKVFDASVSTLAGELWVSTTYDQTVEPMNALYVLRGGLQGWEAEDTGYGHYAVLTDEAVVDIASSGLWTTSARRNDGTGTASVDQNTRSVPRSDAIRLWLVEGEPAFVQSITNSAIRLSANPGIGAGEMLLLADCASVNVVRACEVSGRSDVSISMVGCEGVANDRVLTRQPGALAFALVGRTYFVGRRVHDDPTSAVTLYLREWRDPTRSRAQPILENIESLQFLYGEDIDQPLPDSAADRYVTAADVDDWERVVSVRMEILLQSERDDLLDGEQTLAFNGKEVIGADGRLRYALVATIALRNRTP
jgi:type IV pilus assembly protein PilW